MAVEAPDLRIELAPVAEAYERAGRRLVDLLRQIPDPTAPTKGLRWTLGELTAHLAARTELFAGYLAGTAVPEGEIADIAANNDRQIRESRDVPFDTHVELIAASVGAFAETTRGRLGADPYPWYSGITLDVATGTGIALAEVLVHGHDAARSLGTRWPISAEDARTILRASFAVAPWYVDPATTSGEHATYRVLIRGGPRLRLRIDDGTGVLEGAAGPADCTIRAEPVSFLLVSYGRASTWRAAATGKLLVGGRRPWKALSFDRSFLPP